MDRLFSYSTFGFVRILMALCVFFCHVFRPFNDFGFLFVGVFFFMSGYGMEKSNKREMALKRLVPYLGYFVWFSLIYFLFFQVWPYPSSWFLVVYFAVMLIYRFISNVYGLLWAFVLLACVFYCLGFEFGWSASFGGFLFGVFFARNPRSFGYLNCLCLFPLCLFAFAGYEMALWCSLPLFCRLVLSACSLRCFRPLAFLGRYSFYFYCIHCFVLGLFGATWTLGGEPSFVPVVWSFIISIVVSVLCKDYLFNIPEVKI